MTLRQARWTWSAVLFVAAAAVAGAALERIWTGRPWFAGAEAFGYAPDAAGRREVLREFGAAGRFADVGAEAVRRAQGRDTFLYRAAAAAHQRVYGRPWVVGRQGIGDCVSWGFGHAAWIALAVDWQTGRLEDPPPMVAVESVYGGSRVEGRGKDGSGRAAVGGWSDGSFGAAAARWLREWGVAFRLEAGGHDLREYSPERAKSWGAYGNGGQADAGQFDAFVKAHPVRHVALVRDFAEAAAAIESGFPVAVCSLQAFERVRDQNGFARPAPTTWAHCMAFVAVRYRANGSPDDGLLCLNSWGPSWISGPVWPGDQPAGSFWVSRAVVDRMLGGEDSDSFAVGSIGGFDWRPVDHREWLAPPPPPATVAVELVSPPMLVSP